VTEAQVREIRAAHTGKHGHTKALAEQYGVSKRTIQQIAARATWGWLK
jgi:DNA-directed RNA polymerase sigma subunit (sigma70/sigma32)